jgi:hypothetical protein
VTPDSGRLTPGVAARFVDLALGNVAREYPAKLDHILNGPQDVRPPSTLHPAFWGSFDWHSCVHGHWMLVRLLRAFADAPFAPRVRAHLDARLTPANVAAEIAYLVEPYLGSFVRTYGWAWLLKLAEELARGAADDGHGHDRFGAWRDALAPLAARFVDLYLDYLPRARVPLRYGLHPNSAFGLAFALDYAERVGVGALREIVREKALDWYARDLDYPAHLEPSGSDFLSPALVEADLMRRVLDRAGFPAWLARFLPGLERGEPAALFTPVDGGDHSDPQIVHLDGLNLSRAWCYTGIASALDGGDARRAPLAKAARAHLDAGVPTVLSGDYMGEHWLATFAVYALTAGG